MEDSRKVSNSVQPGGMETKRERHMRLMNERLAKIEHDYKESKSKLYQSKLEQLRTEMSQIQDGTHPEFARRIRLLEQEKESLIEKAKLWKEYQVKLVDELTKREVEAAELDYESEKTGLRDRILSQIEERRKRIREEREFLSIETTGDVAGAASRANSRKLRKRGAYETGGFGGAGESRSRKRQQGASLNQMLKESEIMEDLVVLSKYLTTKKTTSKRRGGK